MIKAVIFDLDGVYFKNGKSNFIKSLVDLGVSEDEAKRVFLKSDLMNKSYKAGKISGEEFWTWAAKEWNIKKSPEELIKILQKGYELNEIAMPLIKLLKAKGIKLIICSNNFKERIKCLDERFNFVKDFDYSILSYEYGILKPELFKKIKEKTGFDNSEVLILDDGEDLIKEAIRQGFNAVLCKDNDDLKKYLRDFGVLD